MIHRRTKVKSIIFFGIIYILLLPLLAIGCERGTETTPISTVPVVTGNDNGKIIDVTLDQFTGDKNQVKNIVLVNPGTLTIRLASNPTTGYEWAEAVISDTGVIKQSGRNFAGPENTKLVGSGGTDVWTFDSLKTGTASITFSYGRPWEGGEKGTFILTVNITVK
jgi:predicted secreted protein